MTERKDKQIKEQTDQQEETEQQRFERRHRAIRKACARVTYLGSWLELQHARREGKL